MKGLQEQVKKGSDNQLILDSNSSNRLNKPPTGNSRGYGTNTRNNNLISQGSSMIQQEQYVQVHPITSTDELSIKEYQQMRSLINGPEAATVPQSAYVSILGSGFSNIKERQMEREYLNNFGSTQKLPFLEPYKSKQGDQMIASRQAYDDDDNDQNYEGEDRKETEQLPITKDLLGLNGDDDEDDISDNEKMIRIDSNRYIKNSQNAHDSSEDMNGVDVEFNEVERTVAQKTIRRSVVKDKLNWSCQFGQGVFSKNTKTLDGIQKLFMDSRGAAHAINSIKNKRQYHISQNTLLFELSMTNKDLKYITVNMLCKNLKIIDLQNNKLETLPEEISDLMFLEKLKVDNNQLKYLPRKLSYLNMLQTLTICNNLITELPNGIEELTKLEILLVNDNKLSKLTPRIGNLTHLKKLFLHNNLLQEIPSEIYKLGKLKEFSLDWFMYLNPPMPRIMRDSQGLVIIDKIKTFCKSTLFQQDQQSLLVEDWKSFSDFILYHHQIKPNEINQLTFGPKKRGILHQVCMNAHSHLLMNIVKPSSEIHTSSQQVSKIIDLNLRDKEGSTALCYAFRRNHEEIISIFLSMDAKRLDLNVSSPKYGSPLHLSILKHKFSLALTMIEEKDINTHNVNPNGSNAMHVLFANYMFDEQHAEKLAIKLIKEKVNVNLVDNNGLTPIHVAINKSQMKALEFAWQFNKTVNYSQEAPLQKFNFNQKGKKNYTPLHYSVQKTNYEAFLFLLSENLCDIWALDQMFRTARNFALINSPFYKILFQQERRKIYSEAYKINQERKQILLQSQKQDQLLRKTGNNQQLLNNRSVDFKYRQILEQQKPQLLEDQDFKHINLNRRCIKNDPLGQQKINNKSKFYNRKDLIHTFKKQNSGPDKVVNSNQQPTHRLSVKKSDVNNPKPNMRQKEVKNQFFDYKQKLNQNIPHHQNMIMEFQNDSNEPNIVNNIFISNLNINVNLNINISIPPSPLSTKGNGSRMDSNLSIEEIKEHNFQNQKQDSKKSFNVFKRSHSPHINFQDDALASNMSVRYEDLSVIDDEMPIKNKINKNLKPEQLQGIIDQIQPEIYRNLTQSLNQNHKGGQSPLQKSHKNNIYINMCSIGQPNNPPYTDRSFDKPEDIESSCIKASPRRLNNTKISQHLFQGNDQNDAEVMKRNFSQILQEEPIHICHNQTEQSKFNQSLQPQDKTFMSYLSNSKFSQQNKDLQNNRFFKEYLILSSEKELMSIKYKCLYQNMAICQITQDENVLKDAMDVILKVIIQMTRKSPMLQDLIYMLTQLAQSNLMCQQYLDQAHQQILNNEQDTGKEDTKTNQNNQLLVNMELVNAQMIKEINAKNQQKYPQISTKLNQYLQENKKRNPSIQSRSTTPLINHLGNHIEKHHLQGQLDDFYAHKKQPHTSQNIQKQPNLKPNSIGSHQQSIDDANVTTERFAGTLKLSQLKILNAQNQQVFSPSIKDRMIQSKVNNFSSVRNSQQAEQKTGRIQIEKQQSITKLASQSMQGQQLKNTFEKKRLLTQNSSQLKKILNH